MRKGAPSTSMQSKSASKKSFGDSQNVEVQAERERRGVEERQQVRLSQLEDLPRNYKILFYEHLLKDGHDYYVPKKECFFNEKCANASKINLPRFEGECRGIEKLDLLHDILKRLEEHFTTYHKKSDDSDTEKRMLSEVVTKRLDIVTKRVEIKRQQEQEAEARREAELDRQLKREQSESHRFVLRQRIAKSAIRGQKGER